MALKTHTFFIKPNMDGYKDAITLIDTLLANDLTITVTVTDGVAKKRTLSANALQHVWIKQIADFSGETLKNTENELKRDIGLRVLLGEGDQAAIVLGYMLEKCNYYTMTEEQKREVMNVIAVTSVMSSRQHKRYLDEVQMTYAQQGLILESRND